MLARRLLSRLVLWRSAHRGCTLRQQSLYHAYNLGVARRAKTGLRLACASPLWQFRARAKGEAVAALARSLSRRSSVVEHVIGNDGVGSSILPDGTISRSHASTHLTPPRRLSSAVSWAIAVAREFYFNGYHVMTTTNEGSPNSDNHCGCGREPRRDRRRHSALGDGALSSASMRPKSITSNATPSADWAS